MSYKMLEKFRDISQSPTLTNDLLYESKDSREIENASISSLFRVLLDVPETFDRRGHNPFFSGGEGLLEVSSYSEAAE
jgi:hypothetical protein